MTSRSFDVVALGELLVDFTENGASEQGNALFEANPGGAPCNVLAMLKKLGRDCAFIGKVGDDMFGAQLRQVAQDAGICMDALTLDRQVRTTLAFVKTLPGGDRDFSFYRNPGADMMLTPEEIDADMVSGARIFHFGSLSLTHEPVRSATQKAVAAGAGIDLTHLAADGTAHTTLAFVKTLPGGDRDFSFYRNPGADMMLTPDEVSQDVISGARIFHFGSLSLTHEPVRSATRKAVSLAKAQGAIISFDPNLRPPLWDDLEEAREQIAWGLAQCDVLKIADNELEFMTGETDFDKGAAILKTQYPNIKLLCATAGAEGSHAYFGDVKTFQPAFKLGGTIETTGAGDTFCACVLNFVLDRGLDGLTKRDLDQMLRFANAAAYLVTTKKGAIRSMPEREQVEALL